MRILLSALCLLLTPEAHATSSVISGASGGGDASAANQVLQTAKLTTSDTAIALIKTNSDKIPTSPSAEHTTAASPNSCRLSDGAAFLSTLPVSLATLPALVASGAVIGHVINDASSAVIGHVIADTGSTTAVTGTVAANATLAAETTKVIGTVNIAASQTVGLVAGAAKVGQFAVDQTTPGTTNLVSIGTNGTVSLSQTTTANDVDVVSVIPGAGATNLGKAEDAAHTSSDTGVLMLGVRKDTATQVTNADSDYTAPSLDAYGATFVRSDHPNRIRCTTVTSVATVITAMGGSCAAPGAGLSIYITDILFDASAAGIAADAFPTLKFGTGGTCGTGTTVFWGALSAAAVSKNEHLVTPIKITANNEVCWISSTAGSKFITILGYIAP